MQTRRKSFGFVFLVFLFVFIMCFEAKGSKASTIDGIKGKGTNDNPYIINTYDQLCILRDKVNAGDKMSGKYFKQTDDIFFPADANWTPIGCVDKDIPFDGIYDGSGFTINGINCENQYAGLFGLVSGEIQNLGIESGRFYGTCAGSITSHGKESGKIYNCYNKSSVTGDLRAGGIADNFAGSIICCWNLGKIQGLSEKTITAGICSYGSAEVIYCFSFGVQPVSSMVFSGKSITSQQIDNSNILTGLYNAYRYSIELMNRDADNNTVFLRWRNQSIYFDTAFSPETFLECYESKDSFSGKGTEKDPYLISSYTDLCLLRDIVDEGIPFSDSFFRQECNIVFPDDVNWNPIGNADFGYAFEGYYDGNGYVLKNINCSTTYASFIELISGEVRNLGIDSGSFIGSCVGSVASHGKGTPRIINCYNKANVSGSYRVGGIADNLDNGTIAFCINMGDVDLLDNMAVSGEIASYKAGRIISCYSIHYHNTDIQKVYGDTDKQIIAQKPTIDEAMSDIYTEMWDMYKNDQTLRIDRGSIVFYRIIDGALLFDIDYEPDVFLEEKKQSLIAFKSIYNRRFDFVGDGTKESPYIISCYDDLVLLRDAVDIGVQYRDCYFKQCSDITIPPNVVWNPIGDTEKSMAFYGIYDGAGHRIYNLNCNDTFGGFFSLLAGEVYNLGIETGSITGGYIGSFTSHGIGNCKIVNCYSKADLICYSRGGGIADNFSGSIMNTLYLGTIQAVNKDTVTAAIVSYNATKIENCFFHGDYGYNIVCDTFYRGIIHNCQTLDSQSIDSALKESYSNLALNRNAAITTIIPMYYNNATVCFADDSSSINLDREDSRKYIPFVFLISIAIFSLILLCILSYTRKDIKDNNNSIKTKQDINIQSEKPTHVIVIKRIAGCIIVFCIVVGCVCITANILNTNIVAGVLNMRFWEKPENSKTDVLLVGSSSMSVNLELAELWNQYGIAGFCIGAGGMDMHDSYYRIIDAEKSHHTSMIVLDARAFTYTGDYTGTESKIENVSGLRISMNKMRYVNAAVETNNRLDFFLSFPLFHKRYKELYQWDFTNADGPLGKDDKGTWTVFYGSRYNARLSSAKDILGYRAIDPKREYYFKKIASYCRNKGIELILIKTPDDDREKNQPIYNTVALLAEECSVPYVDLNLHDREVGLVPSDFYEDSNHLNVVGARKCAVFWGEYLLKNYNMKDHRNDDDYASWDQFSENREGLYLKEISNRDDYVKEIKDRNIQAIRINFRTAETSDQKKLEQLIDLSGSRVLDLNDYTMDEMHSIQFTNDIVISLMWNQSELMIDFGETKATIHDPCTIIITLDNTNHVVSDAAVLSSDNTEITHLIQRSTINWQLQ